MRIAMLAGVAVALAACGPNQPVTVVSSPGTVVVDRPWFGRVSEQAAVDRATAECQRHGGSAAVLRGMRTAPRIDFDADRMTFECR